MNNKYFAKIIAKDQHGLQMISAHCSEAFVKVNEIKFLKSNKIFLMSLNRLRKEISKSKERISSILKFEYISSTKSKNIDQTKTDFFCIINADGSMNPKYLIEMMQRIKNKNLDFLFASRYEKPGGGSDDDDFVTSIGNFLFTKIGNIFFSLKITDILFTYVMGKTKSFNNLNLNSFDFTLCIEFPIKAARKNCSIGTIPSYERARIGGKKKVNAFKDGLLILIKMIKMFFFR